MGTTPKPMGTERSRPGGVWSHVLVSVSACVLTVAVVGTAVFVAWRVYERQALKVRVKSIIAALENRTPEELAERVSLLKTRPKLAAYVLPELDRILRSAKSERQLCAAIEISRAFLNHRRIERAMYRLRRDAREDVAAAAVRALSEVEPLARVAELLGSCLDTTDDESVLPAVVDEVCAGLLKLGQPGLDAMRGRLSRLSADRRVWLAGYVAQSGSPHSEAWLELLKNDSDERVRRAAAGARGTHVPAVGSSAVARGR